MQATKKQNSQNKRKDAIYARQGLDKKDSIKAQKDTHEIEKINAEIEHLVDLAANLAAKGIGDIEQIAQGIQERKQRIDEIELSQERNLTFMERAKISISPRWFSIDLTMMKRDQS